MNIKVKGTATAIAVIIVIAVTIYAVNMRRNTVDPSILTHLKETLKPSFNLGKILNDGKVIVKTNRKKYNVSDVNNIMVTVINCSKQKLHFPSSVLFEIEIDGDWYVVNTYGIVITNGYYVDVGESRTEPINNNFDLFDFEWIPGHYRIIEYILFDDRSGESWAYSAEFYLK